MNERNIYTAAALGIVFWVGIKYGQQLATRATAASASAGAPDTQDGFWFANYRGLWN